MTTEIEEQFFKVFGIKPIFRYFVQSELPVVGTGQCRPTYDLTKEQFKNFALSRAKEYKLVKIVKIYPEITDHKLLQMICINSQKGGIEIFNRKNIEELKNSMIQHCIDRLGYALNKEQYKAKIQQLFKEE